jgi:general stress protein YciG
MPEKSNRGFAGMDAEKQRQIASKGGKAAHAKGTAHKFTPAEAREAGRKGGQAAHQKGTAHEFTPEEAREAGRKGGLRAHRNGENGTAAGSHEPAPVQALSPLPPAPVPQTEMPQGMPHEMES